MKPHPDPMVRSVLEELYPSPLALAFRLLTRAAQETIDALAAMFARAGVQFSAPTTCRLCGGTGDHHEGCLLDAHV